MEVLDILSFKTEVCWITNFVLIGLVIKLLGALIYMRRKLVRMYRQVQSPQEEEYQTIL